MVEQYNLNNIRVLLTEGFNAEELRSFCHDDPDFRAVYNQLTEHTSRTIIVGWLLEYANQKLQIEALLTWAKEHNPAMYEKHQPYHKVDLESIILEALYDYYKPNFDSPEMKFVELCKIVGVPIDDKKSVAAVWSKLFTLQQKIGWVKYQRSEDVSSDVVQITSEGIRVIEERRRRQLDSLDISEPFPVTLEELMRRDQHCASLIKRDWLLHDIKECLTQSSGDCPFILLRGQPMVGKTSILDRLCHELGDEYLPLMVTGQGAALNKALGNLEAFIYDLADQLTNKFEKWAKLHQLPSLREPNRNDFGEGKAIKAFYRHWQKLRNIAEHRKTVVMFDEIEHLLDYPKELNRDVLMFLDNFVCNPENGYFIIAGSERIQFARNREFSLLIGKGHTIEVGHYDEEIAHIVFSSVQKYFAFENEFLQYCISLCDGHPRFLPVVFEAIVHQAISLSRKQELKKIDTELILSKVIRRAHDPLWALWQNLSREEQSVVWLISQNLSGRIDELEYSLDRLIDLAGQYFIITSTDQDNFIKAVADLELREWIDRKNGGQLIRFKLGLILLWLQRRQIKPDHMGNQ